MKSAATTLYALCCAGAALAAPSPQRGCARGAPAHDGRATAALFARDNVLKFLVDAFTTQNARQGEPFKAVISGLLTGAPEGEAVFSRADGSPGTEWITVTDNGTLQGTPGSDARPGRIKVMATTAGAADTEGWLDVDVPVVARTSPLAAELSVMTFNLWQGGTEVNDYHRKQVSFLVESGADIVGLQESWGGHAERLGRALGWDYWQGDDVGILSRYPIAEYYGAPAERAGAVRVSLGDGDVNVWNVHLGYDPYGPYDFCFSNMTHERVLEREVESGRTPQIKAIVKAMEAQLAAATGSGGAPVLLTGDFNAPSHLDWTAATAAAHCGVGDFAWPSSTVPTSAGLRDTFREALPDPAADPGITWSPIFLDNQGRQEPLDRIDFVYAKGRVAVLASEAVVVGRPAAEPNQKNNDWTSDHAAVISKLRIQTGS